jgi:hypothetical protein
MPQPPRACHSAPPLRARLGPWGSSLHWRTRPAGGVIDPNGCLAKQTCFYDFTVTGATKGGRLTLASTDTRILSESGKSCTPYEALVEGVWEQTRS